MLELAPYRAIAAHAGVAGSSIKKNALDFLS